MDKNWSEFTSAWRVAMQEFQSGRFTMEQAFDLIGKHSEEIDDEIEQFACNVISEVGGSPGSYAETLSLLLSMPSEAGVLDFMNS